MSLRKIRLIYIKPTGAEILGKWRERIMNVDLVSIVILVLSALVIGGGGYAVIAKKKFGELIGLFAAPKDAFEEFQKSIADSTITPDEKAAIIEKAAMVVTKFKALIKPA
jgi:hypothetical protein